MKSVLPSPLLLVFSTAFLAPVYQATGALYDNLRVLSSNISVGSGARDPFTDQRADGPKWVTTGDLDGDGHFDFATCHLNGEITVVYGRGDGSFDSPVIIRTSMIELRSLESGDLDGDGRTDLAATAPLNGKILVMYQQPGRRFAPPALVPAFYYVRNLALGDWDGDGRLDMAGAGPDAPVLSGLGLQAKSGVIQYRNMGGRQFQKVANVADLAVTSKKLYSLKTVYSLEPFRPAGETKDWLVATYSIPFDWQSRIKNQKVWVLGADAAGLMEVKTFFPGVGAEDIAIPYQTDGLRVGAISYPISDGRLDLVATRQKL